MTESESVALPLGDAPLTNDIITDSKAFVNSFLQNILKTEYGMNELPSNMLPVSQLEAILGAVMAHRISVENKAQVLYNYKGLDVLTIA